VNNFPVFRLVGAVAIIWMSASFAAGQITPFTTQPQQPAQSQQNGPPAGGAAGAAPAAGAVPPAGAVAAAPGAQTSVESIRPNYELGPSDQILIHAPDAEELNDKTFRVEDDGTATLPLLGVIKIGGLTLTQVEDDLKNRLKTYVRNPLVSITVVQFRSSPVFFVGQFQKPGIYALQGRHTLVEMMQSVGGLQPTAGRRIKVTRKIESGPIPLSSAVTEPGGKTTSVEVSLVSLTENINPADDIELQPYDVVSVDRAEQVYVQGGLAKTGGFDVGDRDYISALQLLSEAGGLAPGAYPERAVILRPVLDTGRRAIIHVDLAKVLSTEGIDYPLLPNDVLYVPVKKPKSVLVDRLETILLSTGISVLIYGLINHSF
jgi:polysaccharide export outer membrane protein